MFAAQIRKYTESESTLAERLLPRLHSGRLRLAARGFFSFALWGKASATGADLFGPLRTDSAGLRAQHVQDLPDGSWRVHLKKSTDRPSVLNRGGEFPLAYSLATAVAEEAR